MADTAASQRTKRATLIACILGSSIVFLDGTIVNVALPAIRDEFDAGLSTQQWVVDAYLLTLGALLLVGGSLGDLLGLRRVFRIGVAGFGATSLLCAVAPSAGLLVVGRALQGVAGALLIPSTLGILVATFDEHERGRAIGTWTAWTGAATVIGPLVGGLLVDGASWRWVFAVNVPVVVGTIWVVQRFIPELATPARGRRLDLVGALLCAVGLGGIVFGLIEQPIRGFSDPAVFLSIGVGAACLFAFPLYERLAPDPMLPLGMFAVRNFTVGNLATVGIYAGLSVVFFLTVVFLQEVGNYSALASGAALLPVTVIMFFGSRRFGALADRLGPYLFMTAGPLVAAAGVALFLRVDASPDYIGELLPALLVFGFGLTMTVAPLTATVLGHTDQRRAGIASGINNAVARVAGLIGIAVVGAVVSAQFSSSLDSNLASAATSPAAQEVVDDAKTRPLSSPPVASVPDSERARVTTALEDASVSSFHVGIGLAAGLVAAGGLISMIGIRNPRRVVEASRCPGGALVGGVHRPAAIGRPASH
jgi:EmrB/QacA subfamily drug resistance transporter